MTNPSEHDAWHKRWRDGRIGFHKDSVNQYLITYWPRLSVPAAATVFVPLCGKALDLHWLAEQHAQVIGVELSSTAVADFFLEAGLAATTGSQQGMDFWEHDNIRIYCGDFFLLQSEHLNGATAFFDRASLIALPKLLRSRYQQHLATLMPVGSLGLTVTIEYPQSQMNGPPFSVSEEELTQIAGTSFDISKLAAFDVLSEEGKFRERGVSSLTECVHQLVRKD